MQNASLHRLFGSLYSVCLFACLSGCSTPQVSVELRPEHWAHPVGQVGEHQIENLFKVDDGLYRSAQLRPEDEGQLRRLGIGEVLSLRKSRPELVSSPDLVVHNVPMKASRIIRTDAGMVAALRILRDRESPLIVHCRRGADRTGCLIALNRMLNQGWSREEAIAEMRTGGFGFYEGWANIVRYLREVDLEEARRLVKGSAPLK